jgi:hypothetical protein
MAGFSELMVIALFTVGLAIVWHGATCDYDAPKKKAKARAKAKKRGFHIL